MASLSASVTFVGNRGPLLSHKKITDSNVEAAFEAAVRVRTFIQYYPPTTTTRYRRTGNLGRSWRAEIKKGGDGVVATVFSANTPGRENDEGGYTKGVGDYNHYVQGENQQAQFKRRGWRTVVQAQLLIERQFAAMVQKRLDGV